MNKEEYYKRMSKIDAMARTDRTSIDEDYHIACQRYYLSNKYIKTLEQENKQLKEQINKIKQVLDNQIDYREFVDIVNEIDEILKENSNE